MENAPLSVFWVESSGKILYVNFMACKKLKYDKKDLVDKTVFEIDPNFSKEEFPEHWEKLRREKILNFETYHQTKDKYIFPVEITSRFFLYQNNEFAFVFAKDITKEKKYREKLKEMSYHDQLTGLYNRRFAEEELQRLDTKRQLPLSIMLIDINGLKQINDNFGHQIGDKAIKKTAEILKKALREEDICARWGGDEFIIILPATDNEESNRIYRRIKERCKETNIKNVNLSFGVGISTKYKEIEQMNEIINRADKKMYENKLKQKE